MFIDFGIMRETDTKDMRERKCLAAFLFLKQYCYTEQERNGEFSKTDPLLECFHKIFQYNNFCKHFKFKIEDHKTTKTINVIKFPNPFNANE